MPEVHITRSESEKRESEVRTPKNLASKMRIKKLNWSLLSVLSWGFLASDADTNVQCVSKTPEEVQERINDILRIVRNSPSCHGPLGLLRDTSTAKADGTRVAHRRCTSDVLAKLELDPLPFDWSLEKQLAYRTTAEIHSETLILNVHKELQIGFVAQQFWDLLVYDLFFKNAPKRQRFYFEAGARNGVTESNTYFFEKYLGWRGVLVEPSKLYRCAVPKNRPHATVIHGALCETPFIASPYDPVPTDCAYLETDSKPPCYNWKSLQLSTPAFPRKLDIFSFDVDNKEVQDKLLMEMDWSGPDRPSVVLVECYDEACLEHFRGHGYNVVVLENNQKIGKTWGTAMKDILAWHDTCAAFD